MGVEDSENHWGSICSDQLSAWQKDKKKKEMFSLHGNCVQTWNPKKKDTSFSARSQF